MLRLKTFGTASLQGDDITRVVIAAAQRRQFGLLAMLAVAGERGMSRDTLIGALWPDATDDQARHRLAQTIYKLRREFGAADILIGSSELHLNPETIQTDVAEFRAALASGDTDRLATLYSGPFLDGFYVNGAPEFERWSEVTRRHFANQARTAFEQAARAAVADGDAHRAVEWWRRVATSDPLDARAALGLMEALTAIGDRSGALQHARAHGALVREQLDAPPDPGVIAFAARLKSYAAPTALEAAASDADNPTPFSINASRREAPRAVPEPSAESRPRGRVSAVVAAALLLIIALGARVTLDRRTSLVSSPIRIVAVGTVRDYSGADSSGVARALTDMLATNLARVPGLHVVSTARIYELLGRSRQHGDLAAQISSAAREAGASEIVEGTMYRQRAGIMRFDLRRVDLASGVIRESYTVEGANSFELIDRATSEVAADVGKAATGPLHVADVSTHSLVAYRFYEEGLRANYQQNDAQVARRLFLAALEQDSTFVMAQFHLAKSELALNMPTAIDRFVHAARLADRGAASERERLLLRGTAAGYSNDPSGRAIAETLATRYSTEPDGQYLLGELMTSGGDFLGAIPHLRRVVQMDSLGLQGTTPRCRACEAFAAIVRAYWLADSLAAAERVAREWAVLKPMSSDPWFNLSNMLLFQTRYDAARSAMRTAERVAPGSQDPMLEVSIALRAGEFAQADTLLQRRWSEAREIDAAWFLTLSLRAQGRLRDALGVARAMRPRTAIGDRAPLLRLAEAIVLFDMGRDSEAAAIFSAIASAPAFAPEYRSRNARDRAWNLTHEATARAAAGDTVTLALLADSIEHLGMLSAYGRDQRLHHYVRGLLFRSRGQFPAAADELRRGMFSPTAGYTRDNYELARTLLALHSPSEAIAALQPAFRGSLEASNAYVTLTELHELLAEAFDAAAKPDSAAVHYRYVVRAWKSADAPFRARWAKAQTRVAALKHERSTASNAGRP
jgi:DNA-binding SARP family transcriptional activator/TolB-like protein